MARLCPHVRTTTSRTRGIIDQCALSPHAFDSPSSTYTHNTHNTHTRQARFPNTNIDKVLDIHSWAFCGKGSTRGTCVDRPDKWSNLSATAVNWTGALATLSLGGRYATYTRTVLHHTIGTSRFNYDGNLGPGPGSKHTGVGNRYWLSGKLAALDSPGEWFIDEDTWDIFVWMPDGATPGNRLSVKVRDYGVDSTAPLGVVLSNVTLHACTFRIRNCARGCAVRDVNVTYPSYHRHVHLRDPLGPFTIGPPPNITVIEVKCHSLVNESNRRLFI